MSKSSKNPVAGVTYFVVQPFAAAKGKSRGIVAEAPIQASSHAHALRMVERLKDSRAGVVAFRRTGTPTTGDWEDAVIIARHGVLPADVDELTDESGDEATAA